VCAPEQQLQAFLDSLPQWRRKWLKYEAPFDPDWISNASPEQRALAKEQLATWSDNLDEDIALREQYEALLRLIPSLWREYRNKRKQMALSDLPASRPGRKPETELAERVGKLRAEGKTSREIQQKLQSEGKNHSLAAIESYLKTRRKNPRG